MNTLMEKKGRLDLVVSRGWMSTWEASVLEAGTVVIGDSTRAGQPAEITFNGRFIGRGSVLVLGAESGDCAAVRIEELEREELEAPEPDRGSELIELLGRRCQDSAPGTGTGRTRRIDGTHPRDCEP